MVLSTWYTTRPAIGITNSKHHPTSTFHRHQKRGLHTPHGLSTDTTRIDVENKTDTIDANQLISTPNQLISTPIQLIWTAKQLISTAKQLISTPKNSWHRHQKQLISTPTQLFERANSSSRQQTALRDTRQHWYYTNVAYRTSSLRLKRHFQFYTLCVCPLMTMSTSSCRWTCEAKRKWKKKCPIRHERHDRTRLCSLLFLNFSQTTPPFTSIWPVCIT